MLLCRYYVRMLQHMLPLTKLHVTTMYVKTRRVHVTTLHVTVMHICTGAHYTLARHHQVIIYLQVYWAVTTLHSLRIILCRKTRYTEDVTMLHTDTLLVSTHVVLQHSTP